MISYATKIYDDLVMQIETIETETPVKITYPDQRLVAIEKAIHNLKKKFGNSVFKSEAEEIRFFRDSLPRILSLRMYYEEKALIHTMRETGSEKRISDLIQKTQKRIARFFRKNDQFVQYYLSGQTNMDAYYFLLGSPLKQDKQNTLSCLLDPFYGTIYSVHVATIMAYTRLEQELSPANESPAQNQFEAMRAKFGLDWTDSKAALIELIYALAERGSFNNGKVTVKQIVKWVEFVFNVNLGNTSSVFQEFLSRKISSTVFLDTLTKALNGRIDRIEERNMRG